MAITLGTNCGFCASAPTADPNPATNTNVDFGGLATKDTGPVTGTITEIGLWIDNATEAANLQLGLYSDDTADEPNLLLEFVEFAKGTTAGWKVATGLDWAITEGTAYWLAAQCDDTATTTRTEREDGGGGNGRASLAFSVHTALPADWGTSAATDADGMVAIYALTATAGGDPEARVLGGKLLRGGLLFGGTLIR